MAQQLNFSIAIELLRIRTEECWNNLLIFESSLYFNSLAT
jgi:hypothetical protein